MKIAFRWPGPPSQDWSEEIDWPVALRVPVKDEMVDLPDHGQVYVESVQWFADAESLAHNGGLPYAQLIVR